MKINNKFAPLAALVFTLFSSNANAVIIDFIEMTQGAGQRGESAWTTLSVPGAFGLDITGHAPAGDDDQQQYAYLDWGIAGLGVCKDAINVGFIGSGSTANQCSPSSDDNVTFDEYLDFVFDEAVEVTFYFNNNHDGGFGAGDQVTIDGGDYNVATGYVPGSTWNLALAGMNGIGSFFVGANDTLRVAFKNEQFYISGIEVNAVPVPAAVWLFGTALAGLIGYGKRRRATA